MKIFVRNSHYILRTNVQFDKRLYFLSKLQKIATKWNFIAIGFIAATFLGKNFQEERFSPCEVPSFELVGESSEISGGPIKI